MAAPDEVEALRQRYVKGGMGYGEAKTLLADAIERLLGPARERRFKLAADPDCVEDILAAAGKRARAVAREVMADVRDACGIITARGTHR